MRRNAFEERPILAARRVLRTLVNFAVLMGVMVGTTEVASSQQPVVLQGTVLDATTGVPVSNALLILNGTSARALSTDDGSFRLVAPSEGTYTVSVQRYGYEDLEQAILVVDAREDVVVELVPMPVQLDSLVVAQRRVSLDGAVHDRERDIPLMDAEVFVDGELVDRSNPRGRFRLDDLWEGTPTLLSLRAFGYLAADTVFFPAQGGSSLNVALTPDPLIEAAIVRQVSRLRERMGGWRTITIPAVDRDALLQWTGLSLLEFIDATHHQAAGRIRCIIVDEILVAYGWERDMLTAILPGEVQRIESLFDGAMLRIYTRKFMRAMVERHIELQRPVYVALASPPLCK